MKNLTWQNPEQLFVAQELINKVKSKCCGIKVNKELLHNFVLKFREEYTTKNANIYVYNKSDIANLIDKYPLNDKEAELLLSCTIAESWFTNPTEVYVNLS